LDTGGKREFLFEDFFNRWNGIFVFHTVAAFSQILYQVWSLVKNLEEDRAIIQPLNDFMINVLTFNPAFTHSLINLIYSYLIPFIYVSIYCRIH